jgi:hypothetical protein
MRPVSIEFDPVLADEILERLADGDSLASICCDEEMPDERSVRRRARNRCGGRNYPLPDQAFGCPEEGEV